MKDDYAPKPTREREAQIYQMLVEGHPRAQDHLVRAFLFPMVQKLKSVYTHHSLHDIVDDVVIDTLCRFGKDVGRFEPARGSLWHYLLMDAHGDIRNLAKSATKRSGCMISLDDVELEPAERNESIETQAINAVWPAFLEYVPEGQHPESLIEALNTIRNAPELGAIFDLWQEGVRETDHYAKALGIQDWPSDKRKQKVKQVKDRLITRLRRLGEKLQ